MLESLPDNGPQLIYISSTVLHSDFIYITRRFSETGKRMS